MPWIAGLAAAQLLSCASPGPEAGEPSSAPTFNAIEDEQLESAMWRLAAGVQGVQAILGKREPVTPSQRAEVMRILDQMIEAADELGPEGVATNHERLTLHLGRFRAKLEIARDAVAMNPPRYYLVGNLSGTCLACHGR